jgi:hypothetical protein
MAKLVLDTTRSNSVDLHLGQATLVSSSEALTMTSKNSSHCEHLNSYIGITLPSLASFDNFLN